MKQNPARKVARRFVFAASLVSLGILAVLFLSDSSRAKDDWLPITPEDLALKDNPASPGAHAMILYREDFIDAKQAFETEYIRIKIFTEEGKKRGDVNIEYLKGVTGVSDIRARTIRPDGSVVNFEGKPFDKEIVKAGGIKVLAKTFTLPEVQPGCIIEYRYREQHDPKFYWSVTWTVQGELYTRLARYSIKPDNDPGSPPLYWRKYMLPGAVAPDRQKDGTLAMEVKDVSGIADEDLMPPSDALRGRVEFFYRSQFDPSNETPDQYWKRIGKIWNTVDDAYVDKKGALQGIASQTVSANDTPELKLQKLYSRVQQIHNVSYDTEKSVKEEKREKLKDNNNVEDVLKRGYGSQRQLNLLMMGLARAVGFDSAILYVAPRNGPPFLPNMEDINSVRAEVVWVRAGDHDVYLDPASKFYPYGLLPWYETGVSGIKPTKLGADMITIPRSNPGDAIRERHADLRLDADGTISGTIDVNYAGIWGSAEREDEREEDDAGRTKDLADLVKSGLPNGSEFEIASISGWDDSSKPLHIQGKVRIPGFATQAGHRTLVPVTIFLSSEPGYFSHEKRVNPIFFRYPYTENDSVSLRVPDGVKIESVPSEATANPGGGFKYVLKAAQNGGGVTVERQLAVGGIFFMASDYPALRSFFSSVKTHDDTQIVFHSLQASENR